MQIDDLDQITDVQIMNWIKNGEWNILELKENLSEFKKDELPKYYAAFANTEGGLLILGINKQNQTIGCSLNDKERNKISQYAKDCTPHIMGIKIQERDYDNKKITLIYVPKSNMIHQDHNHRFPIKVGAVIDFHNIISLIQSLKERELLVGKIEFLNKVSTFEKRERREISNEDIDWCINTLKEEDKDLISEGLRELEILIYWSDIVERQDLIDRLNELFKNEDIDIKKRLLKVIKDILRKDDIKDRNKLIKKYDKEVLNLVNNEDIEIRIIVIEILIEMNNDAFIEPIIKLIKDDNSIYDRYKPSFRDMKVHIKRKLKIELSKELKNNKSLSEDIKKRIHGIIEDTRTNYYQHF